MLLQRDQGGAGAEAVPGSAVVAQLEILRQRLRQHQRRQDPMVAAYCLYRVTARGTGRQAYVSEGPHLWRGAGERTAGSEMRFYDGFLIGEQSRGLQGCLSLDPCPPWTERQLLSLLGFLLCRPLRCAAADIAHRLMFKLPPTSALRVRPKEG